MAGTLVLTDIIGKTFNDLSAGVCKGTDAGGAGHRRVQLPAVHRRAAPARGRLARPPSRPGAGCRPRRGQRLRVHQADREERLGFRRPGRRRSDAGRQLGPCDGAQPVAAGGGAPAAGAGQGVIDKTHAALLRPATWPPYLSPRPDPGLGSVLVSFISVRGCSPMFTPIVFVQFADGGGRR